MSKQALEDRLCVLEAQDWRGVREIARRIARTVSGLDRVDYDTQTLTGRSLEEALKEIGGSAESAFQDMIRGLNAGGQWLERRSLHNALPQIYRAKRAAEVLAELTSIPWGRTLDEVKAVFRESVRERARELGWTTRKVLFHLQSEPVGSDPQRRT